MKVALQTHAYNLYNYFRTGIYDGRQWYESYKSQLSHMSNPVRKELKYNRGMRNEFAKAFLFISYLLEEDQVPYPESMKRIGDTYDCNFNTFRKHGLLQDTFYCCLASVRTIIDAGYFEESFEESFRSLPRCTNDGDVCKVARLYGIDYFPDVASSVAVVA